MSAPPRRWILAGVILIVACLQAWDSDVLAASPAVWILAGAGILAAASAPLFTQNRVAAWLAAVPVPAVLLVAARVVSPTPLPALLVIVVAAGILLGGNEMIERREAEERSSRGAP